MPYNLGNQFKNNTLDVETGAATIIEINAIGGYTWVYASVGEYIQIHRQHDY